jgi:nitroreductase
MNLLDLVKARYSCRNYQPTSVEQEKLDYIMECVRLAPSAVNKQPWLFHIVSDEEGKAMLQQCYNRDWFKTAPMYIVASILHDEEWVRADGKHHGDIDIAIAVEHLCLAATEQGLATCWVCNFDANRCKELLALPENEEPAVIIPLGYAVEGPCAGELCSGIEVKPKTRKAVKEITALRV